MHPTTAALLHARYGGAVPPQALPPNAVLECLLAHRSVRGFTAAPLPEGTLETLVAAAQSAATSSNMQAWSVVAVRQPERRARLAELAGRQDFVARAPLFLAFLADTSRLQRLGQAQGQPMEGLQYLEAFIVAAVDAGLAAQNAAVAAESLGLGTVYVGALRNRPEDVAAELNLPPGCVALFGLCVGWPDPEAPAAVKPRLPQTAILHHETYDTAREADAIAGYDAALTAFSLSQGIGPSGWVRRMLSRVASAAALGGRDQMLAILHRLGFPLR